VLEKDIERKLHMGVKALCKKAKCLKFESPGFSGVPDRIILLPGANAIFVELKKPGKKERVRQLYVQELLRDLGFEVYGSVDSLEYVDAILNRCKEVLWSEGIYTA
jgi:hypothetical protein